MRGNHLGFLLFGGQGARVHLGRDTRRLIASRRRGWKATKTIQTVYRKESSACGEAARAMRGNHLGSLSYVLGSLSYVEKALHRGAEDLQKGGRVRFSSTVMLPLGGR